MEQPASHPAVHLPRCWRAGLPDAAGSGAAAPDPRYGVKKKRGAALRRGDDGDDSDINIDMGAAVESVVIDVIVVREAGGVSNETGSCFYRKNYDSNDGCDNNDGKNIYERKEE